MSSLQGTITARDLAFQAKGHGNNEAALIELVAAGDIVIASPATDGEHPPTVTTAAEAVNGVGKGGTNSLRSCQGQVRVGEGSVVLAMTTSLPGSNELTAGGGVTILGIVDPVAVSGTSCTNPAPLF